MNIAGNLILIALLLIAYTRLLFFGEFELYVNPIIKGFSYLLYLFLIVILLRFLIVPKVRASASFQWSWLFLLMPCALLMLTPPQHLNSAGSEKRMTSGPHRPLKAGAPAVRGNDAPTDDDAPTDYIAVSDSDYSKCYAMVEKNSGEHLGKTFMLKGRYFRNDEDFLPNQAHIGRLIIICCAAHAIPAPITVQFDSLPAIENDSWIVVKGRLISAESRKGSAAVIKVTAWTAAPAESPYIYPTFGSGGDLPSLNLTGSKLKGKYEHLLPLLFTFFLILLFMRIHLGSELE